MGNITTDIPRRRILFEDGRDGSIAYSVANSRWEDGDGAALSNEARWTGVATTTLTILKECFLRDVTVPVGATLQLGETGSYGIAMIHACGTMSISGTVTAGTVGVDAPGVGGIIPDGGAAKTTAGVGTAAGVMYAALRHGTPGAAGGGGGDGTNAGGSRSVIAGITTQAAFKSHFLAQGSSVSAGTTGAGADGLAPAAMAAGVVSQFDSPWMQWPSPHGFGGSSGALKQAGGTNASGAGGSGGLGKLPLRIAVNNLVTAATAVIHNDGNNGSAGGNGIATNAAGDISGGGGGGGGSGGGPIAILYSTWTDAGASVHSNGGSGGAGGLGFEFNAVARPTSDGGDGNDGTDGCIVTQRAS